MEYPWWTEFASPKDEAERIYPGVVEACESMGVRASTFDQQMSPFLEPVGPFL